MGRIDARLARIEAEIATREIAARDVGQRLQNDVELCELVIRAEVSAHAERCRLRTRQGEAAWRAHCSTPERFVGAAAYAEQDGRHVASLASFLSQLQELTGEVGEAWDARRLRVLKGLP